MDNEATATTSAGETVDYRNEGLATWMAHPDHSAVWLDYRGGSIVAKNPDGPTIAKLVQIATALDAGVQGRRWRVLRRLDWTSLSGHLG